MASLQRQNVLDYRTLARGRKRRTLDARFCGLMAIGLVSYVALIGVAWVIQLYPIASVIRYDEAVAWSLVIAFTWFVWFAHARLRWWGFVWGVLLGVAISALAFALYWLWFGWVINRAFS